MPHSSNARMTESRRPVSRSSYRSRAANARDPRQSQMRKKARVIGTQSGGLGLNRRQGLAAVALAHDLYPIVTTLLVLGAISRRQKTPRRPTRPSLVLVLEPIVDGGDAADGAAGMIEDAVDHVRRNAELAMPVARCVADRAG